MPRSDRLFLTDIVEAETTIQRFLDERSEDEFVADELRHRATLQLLLEIGEAAARISSEFRARHEEIDWRRVVAFRNLSVHASFAIDWSIVWSAATEHAPELAKQVAHILKNEFPEPARPQDDSSHPA